MGSDSEQGHIQDCISAESKISKFVSSRPIYHVGLCGWYPLPLGGGGTSRKMLNN